MKGSRDTGTLTGPRNRTMHLLREAARELLRTGGPLTVPAAAERAGVSRATAYRYFPNNDSVVLHATMSLTDNPLDDADWDSSAVASPDELGARAAELVRATATWAFDHETELRTMLRLSLTPEREEVKPRRGLTNRGRWIGALLKACPVMSRRPHASVSRPPSSRCSDPTPSSGQLTWQSYLVTRRSSSSLGWRESSSPPPWRAGSTPAPARLIRVDAGPGEHTVFFVYRGFPDYPSFHALGAALFRRTGRRRESSENELRHA